MVARAAQERAEAGELDITPYWRTVKVGGVLNEKYPGGVLRQADLLEHEGHTIVIDKSGRPRRVKEFERKLIEL